MRDNQPSSKFYKMTFTIVLLIGLLFFELMCRHYFKISCAIVLKTWLQDGENRGLLLLWLFMSLLFTIFITDHIRNVYVSATSKVETYVFLGDKLREGFYAFRLADKKQEPVFMPWFIFSNQYPSNNFASLYSKEEILKDSEGNFTPSRDLSPGRLLLFGIFQCALFAFASGSMVSIMKEFIKCSKNNNWKISNLMESPMTYFSILVLVIWLGGCLIVWYNMRDVREDKFSFNPPSSIKPNAVVEGTIIAQEDYHINSESKDRSSTRFHRRYAVRFEKDMGFDPPVFVNWDGRKVNEGNISIAIGTLKKELKLLGEYNSLLFSVLDSALDKKVKVKFRVSDDLSIEPEIPLDEHMKEVKKQLRQVQEEGYD